MKTYASDQVAEMLGVPYPSLMRWVGAGLLNPINARQGQGAETRWAPKDLREASVIVGLRRAGLSLQKIKEACAYLRSLGHNPMSTGTFLVVRSGRGEPKDLVKICTTGEALALVKDRGQLVLPLWTEDETTE